MKHLALEDFEYHKDCDGMCAYLGNFIVCIRKVSDGSYNITVYDKKMEQLAEACVGIMHPLPEFHRCLINTANSLLREIANKEGN